MHYHFVEIGTANFDTLIQQATSETRGISVEPIRMYLDQLPSPPGVIKLCEAVSRDGSSGSSRVFYVPPDVIRDHQLPGWVAGCNSVGQMHRTHRKLGIEHLVVSEDVPVRSLASIFQEHDVTQLDWLKLDTEGSDSEILLSYLDQRRENSDLPLPRKISFEANILTPAWQVELVVEGYQALGYRLTTHQPGTEVDTVMELD